MTEIILGLPKNENNGLCLSESDLFSILKNINGITFVKMKYEIGENGSFLVTYEVPESLYHLGIILQEKTEALQTIEEERNFKRAMEVIQNTIENSKMKNSQ
jgi:hypothetical protein